MPSTDIRRRMADLAIFALPVVLVKAASMMLGMGGPKGAEASSGAAPAPVEAQAAPAGEIQWMDAELAAAEHVERLRTEPFGPVPLFFAPDDQPEAPSDEPAPGIDPQLFRVQAILSSGDRCTTLIDNKAYRVGDEIEDSGWTIVQIDAAARLVKVRHQQHGRTETITVRNPV